MNSPKQAGLDKKILKMAAGKALKTAKLLIKDEEIKYLQDYANTVSIKRLHYNDHGPVHMRKVALNALVLLDLLEQKGIVSSLVNEEIGTIEDSKVAVLVSSFLHDIGMTVGRENHEQMSAFLATPIIRRILEGLYDKDETHKRVIVRSLIVEGIIVHMGTQKIHSIEAGTILVADGCDMEQGRARIPMMMDTASQVGDIHKYSSASSKDVKLTPGEQKPIRITVNMTESVGFFQVEETLLKKVFASPIKPYIELYAGVKGEQLKQYL